MPPTYASGVPPAPEAQGVLSFITDEEKRLSVLAYTIRINRILNRGQTKSKKAQSQEIIISVDQLSLPLVTRSETEILHRDPLEEDETYYSVQPGLDDETEKAANINWIADHADQFVGWYLERNFEMLSSVGNPMEKLSIIEWIFAPDRDGEVLLPDGKTWVPLHTVQLPFSFQWCCKAVGLSPERYQDALLEALLVAQDRVKAKHKPKFEALLQAAKEMDQ